MSIKDVFDAIYLGFMIYGTATLVLLMLILWKLSDIKSLLKEKNNE